MSVSSVKRGSVNALAALSKQETGPQGVEAKARIDSLISTIGEKLKAGDTEGVAEGLKKLLDTLGVKNADKILEALGLGKAAKGAKSGGPSKGAESGGPSKGAESGGPAKGAESGGPAKGAESGAPAQGAESGGPAQGAEGSAGGLLELLMKMMKENPELAQQLMQNPELLQKLAQNPQLLQQLAQNPEQLKSVLQGAQAGLPMEFSGISQFQGAPAASPVSIR